MSDLVLPSGANPISFPWEYIYPGDEVLESPFTGKQDFLRRDNGRLAGETVIVRLDRSQQRLAVQISAVLSAWRRGGRSLRVPLGMAEDGAWKPYTYFPTPVVPAGTVVGEVTDAGRVTVSQDLDFQLGDFLRIADHIVQVRNRVSARAFDVNPEDVVKLGQAVSQARWVDVVRRDNNLTLTPRSAEYMGPWRFVWTEAV